MTLDSGGKSFYFATAVLTCPFSPPFALSYFLKRFQSEELEKDGILQPLFCPFNHERTTKMKEEERSNLMKSWMLSKGVGTEMRM